MNILLTDPKYNNHNQNSDDSTSSNNNDNDSSSDSTSKDDPNATANNETSTPQQVQPVSHPLDVHPKSPTKTEPVQPPASDDKLNPPQPDPENKPKPSPKPKTPKRKREYEVPSPMLQTKAEWDDCKLCALNLIYFSC